MKEIRPKDFPEESTSALNILRAHIETSRIPVYAKLISGENLAA
jgi:hypothetical protein